MSDLHALKDSALNSFKSYKAEKIMVKTPPLQLYNSPPMKLPPFFKYESQQKYTRSNLAYKNENRRENTKPPLYLKHRACSD